MGKIIDKENAAERETQHVLNNPRLMAQITASWKAAREGTGRPMTQEQYDEIAKSSDQSAG